MGVYAGIQYVDKKEMLLATAIFVFGILALIHIMPIVIYPFTFVWGAFRKWVFSLRLRRRAKKAGFEVARLGGTLLSAFKSYAGADLILQRGGDKVYIKYLPFHCHGKVVHISEKTVYIARKSALTKDYGNWKRRYDVVSSKAIEIPIEKRSLRRKLNLDFKTGTGDKRIIAYPASVVFMRYVYKTGWVVVDNGVEYLNGEKFYDYKMILRKIKNAEL